MATKNHGQEPKKRRHVPNPTGKGGLQDRPEAVLKGNEARRRQGREHRAVKAFLFHAKLHEYKEMMDSMARYGTKEDSVRLKACATIYQIVKEGEIGLEEMATHSAPQSAPQDLKALVKQVAIDALHDRDPRVRLTAAVAVKADLEANGELEVTKQELDEDHYQEKKLRRELQQENLKMQEKVTKMEQEMAELRGGGRNDDDGNMSNL